MLEMLLLAACGSAVMALRSALIGASWPSQQNLRLDRIRTRGALIAAALLAAPVLVSCTTERPHAGPSCPDGSSVSGCCMGHHGIESIMEDGRVICRDQTVSKICHCKARH